MRYWYSVPGISPDRDTVCSRAGTVSETEKNLSFPFSKSLLAAYSIVPGSISAVFQWIVEDDEVVLVIHGPHASRG
jgi:hypothetical protein